MGAWSTSILSDDFASDVYAGFMDAYNDGVELEAIRTTLERECADALADSDEGPVFWLALAKAQWDCGALEVDVRERVRHIVENGLGLAVWEDEPARDLAKRKKVLAEFYSKLQTPRPNPKKRKKPRLKPAIFAPGDCLTLTLPSGLYGAAVVLVADNNHKTEGQNLVAAVRYRSVQKPSPEVFESRDWLVMNHHGWREMPLIWWFPARGFRRHAPRVEKTGFLQVAPPIPKHSQSYADWDTLAASIDDQFEWEAGKRD